MISLKDKGIQLVNAFEDEIEQEANGIYQLSFKYPTSDPDWSNLVVGDLVLADDLHGEQEFRIFEITKRNDYLFVYAHQVFFDLNDFLIDSIAVDRVQGQTVMTALAGSVMREHAFSFFSDIQGRHTFNEKRVSVMDALAKGKHSIIGQWGGDLIRDKYAVRLLENGGRESEALFMYKKNLTSYVETDSIKGLVTRLHLSIKDKGIEAIVDSPLIESYDGRVFERAVEVSDENVTTREHLIKYGQDYFSKHLPDLPQNSLSIEVTGGEEYDVRLFDMVFVHHERFGKDLRLKITSYKFSPMACRLKAVGFGKIKTDLAQRVEVIVSEQTEKSLSVVSGEFDRKLQKEMTNANAAFEAAFEKSRETIADGIEQAKSKAEVVKAEIGQAVAAVSAQADQLTQQVQTTDQRVRDALVQAGASGDLANAARQLASAAKGSLDNLKGQVEAQAREIGLKLTHDEVMQRVGTALNGYVQTSTFDRYQRETAEGLERRFTETKALIPRRVGGRNYVKNSNFTDGTKHWHNNSGNAQMLIRQDTDFKTNLGRDGTVWLYSNGLTPFGQGIFQVVQGQFSTGSSVTLSFDAVGGYNNESGLMVIINNHLFDKRQTIPYEQIGALGEFTKTSLRRHQLSFDIPHDTDAINLIIIFNNGKAGTVGNIVLTDIMLEDGKIASSHTLAKSEYVSTVDFNRVRETAQLYERILGRTEGDVATNVARQVMTSELMQSEIRKIPSQIGGTNLCSLSDLQIGYRSQGNVSTDPNYVYSDFISVEAGQPYIWQIWNDTGQQVWAGHDFFDANKRYISDSYRSIYQNANYGKYVVVVPSEAKFVSLSFSKAIVDGTIRSKLEKGTIVTDWSPATDDLASSTRVTQLADSYAIKTLGNANQVLSAVNIATGGVALQAGQNKLVITPQTTFIQNGTIKNAMIESLHGGKITAGSVTSVALAADSVTADKLVVDQALFNKLTANEAHLKQLFAKDAFISSVQAVTLSANKISGGVLTALNNAMNINLSQANITFNQNATIDFNSSNNALVRRKGTHTAFVHFNDVSSSSDGGAGSLYASIGVTSSGDGIDSMSSGRFCGARFFRAAHGTQHNATVDQAEFYGDSIILKDDFSIGRGFKFNPTTIGSMIDMNYLVGAVRALARCWLHMNNVVWNAQDPALGRAVIHEYNNHMKDL